MGYNFSKVTCGNRVDFFLEGEKYYNYYHSLIENAKSSIHLQTYIFELDIFGLRIHEALLRAGRRGVHVYVLIDSVGSAKFTSQDEYKLIEAGVHFQRFNGIAYRWLYQWGRRLHHKILLVDYQTAIVGGINVTTSGYGHENVIGQQLDFAVAIEGPVISEISHYCQFVFRKASQKKISMGFVAPYFEKNLNEKDCIELKISINDWVFRRWQITKQYSDFTRLAKKEITIINSYFFPRRKFMQRLAAASRRGVKVRLILPRLSDWPTYILATQFLYSFFIKNGIEIYEWKKSILHGKLATVDNSISTIGSFNLNYTGYQQNLEMNVDIFNEKFTTELNSSIDEIIAIGCERIDAATFAHKSTLKIKFLRLFYYVLLAMVANFSVSLTYQEENGRHNKNKYYNLARIMGSLFFLILGIVGAILPQFPGWPFFIISFLLVYRQLLFNSKINV